MYFTFNYVEASVDEANRSNSQTMHLATSVVKANYLSFQTLPATALTQAIAYLEAQYLSRFPVQFFSEPYHIYSGSHVHFTYS